jgi:hypothetical protein
MIIWRALRSQEVKLLVERGGIKFTLFTGTLLSFVDFVRLFLSLFVHAGQSYASVELGNLVSVLARSGNLDRSSPVVVEVAQGECQVFQIDLTNLGLVLSDIEVSGENASLCRVCGSKVEIEGTLIVSAVVLNELLVDDATRRGVF